jgi:hypothetical protein
MGHAELVEARPNRTESFTGRSPFDRLRVTFASVGLRCERIRKRQYLINELAKVLPSTKLGACNRE